MDYPYESNILLTTSNSNALNWNENMNDSMMTSDESLGLIDLNELDEYEDLIQLHESENDKTLSDSDGYTGERVVRGSFTIPSEPCLLSYDPFQVLSETSIKFDALPGVGDGSSDPENEDFIRHSKNNFIKDFHAAPRQEGNGQNRNMEYRLQPVGNEIYREDLGTTLTFNSCAGLPTKVEDFPSLNFGSDDTHGYNIQDYIPPSNSTVQNTNQAFVVCSTASKDIYASAEQDMMDGFGDGCVNIDFLNLVEEQKKDFHENSLNFTDDDFAGYEGQLDEDEAKFAADKQFETSLDMAAANSSWCSSAVFNQIDKPNDATSQLTTLTQISTPAEKSASSTVDGSTVVKIDESQTDREGDVTITTLLQQRSDKLGTLSGDLNASQRPDFGLTIVSPPRDRIPPVLLHVDLSEVNESLEGVNESLLGHGNIDAEHQLRSGRGVPAERPIKINSHPVDDAKSHVYSESSLASSFAPTAMSKSQLQVTTIMAKLQPQVSTITAKSQSQVSTIMSNSLSQSPSTIISKPQTYMSTLLSYPQSQLSTLMSKTQTQMSTVMSKPLVHHTSTLMSKIQSPMPTYVNNVTPQIALDDKNKFPNNTRSSTSEFEDSVKSKFNKVHYREKHRVTSKGDALPASNFSQDYRYNNNTNERKSGQLLSNDYWPRRSATPGASDGESTLSESSDEVSINTVARLTGDMSISAKPSDLVEQLMRKLSERQSQVRSSASTENVIKPPLSMSSVQPAVSFMSASSLAPSRNVSDPHHDNSTQLQCELNVPDTSTPRISSPPPSTVSTLYQTRPTTVGSTQSVSREQNLERSVTVGNFVCPFEEKTRTHSEPYITSYEPKPKMDRMARYSTSNDSCSLRSSKVLLQQDLAHMSPIVHIPEIIPVPASQIATNRKETKSNFSTSNPALQYPELTSTINRSSIFEPMKLESFESHYADSSVFEEMNRDTTMNISHAFKTPSLQSQTFSDQRNLNYDTLKDPFICSTPAMPDRELLALPPPLSISVKHLPETTCIGSSAKIYLSFANLTNSRLRCSLASSQILINGVAIDNHQHNPFIIEPTLVLAANQQDSVMVLFNPKLPASYRAILTYSSALVSQSKAISSSPNTSVILELSAIAPKIEVNANSEKGLHFGELSWGSQKCLKISLRNRDSIGHPITLSISQSDTTWTCFHIDNTSREPDKPLVAPSTYSLFSSLSLVLPPDSDDVDITIHCILPEKCPERGIMGKVGINSELVIALSAVVSSCHIISIPLSVVAGTHKLRIPVQDQLVKVTCATGSMAYSRLSLKNEGDIEMNLTFTVSKNSNFFSIYPPQVCIQPNNFSEVKVVFSPSYRGPSKYESLCLVRVEPSGPVFEIPVEGYVSSIKSTGKDVLLCNKRRLDFGAIDINNEKSLQLKLRNVSNLPLLIKLELKNADGQFQVVTSDEMQSFPSLTLLPPSTDLPVVVKFCPSRACTINGKLCVIVIVRDTDVSHGGRYAVDLSATGGCSKLTIQDAIQSDSAQYWMHIKPGQMYHRVTVQNTGHRQLYVKAMSFSVGAKKTSIDPSQFTLNPSEELNVSVAVAYSSIAVTDNAVLSRICFYYCDEGELTRYSQVHNQSPDITSNNCQAIFSRLMKHVERILSLPNVTLQLRYPLHAVEDSAAHPNGAPAVQPLIHQPTDTSNTLTTNVTNARSRLKSECDDVILKNEAVIFPTIAPGCSTTLKVGINNYGTVPHSIEIIQPCQPFLVKKSNIVVKEQRYLRLPVEFHPKSVGNFESEILLNVDNGRTLVLKLTAKSE